MKIKTIGVIGAGIMGHGIAYVAAKNGYFVFLVDIKQEFLNKGIAGIRKILKKQIEKNQIKPEEKNEILKRIVPTINKNELEGCELIIEAVPENKKLKQKIFKELDAICPPHTIFASNTSSISIDFLASTTNREKKFIGMHFMNPVPIMPLVEIIRGKHTSHKTFSIIEKTAKKMGKKIIRSQDCPGFILNSILMPMINKAAYLLEMGVATKEDIDKGAKLGLNHPMGPLELADFIGLDTCLAIINVLYIEGDGKKPCPLLEKMVKAGNLGRKTGRGFYNYNK